MSFERIGIRPAQILLPAPGVKPETWACIACDQYTSEPEYWKKAFAAAGDAPSAIRLILPEYNLKNSDTLIPQIHKAMADYLARGLLVPAVDPGFILCASGPSPPAPGWGWYARLTWSSIPLRRAPCRWSGPRSRRSPTGCRRG